VDEAENRETAARVFQAINERDIALFHEQFHADAVIDFPQSGERIAGEENRRGVYSSFPGRADVTRIVTGGALAIVEAKVDYAETKDWRAIFVYEFRDRKIEKATCYWAAPFEPAESRAEWVERIDA
jgi:ketosteroid isomerase-like protein